LHAGIVQDHSLEKFREWPGFVMHSFQIASRTGVILSRFPAISHKPLDSLCSYTLTFDFNLSILSVAIEKAGLPMNSWGDLLAPPRMGSRPRGRIELVMMRPGTTGWIEVICGSMFSGKTEELIRRMRRAQIARQRVQIFKPKIDVRYSDDQIVSHSEMRIRSEVVSSAAEILEKLDRRAEVIGIDEGQFFDPQLVDVCNHLADLGKRVIVAGLDKDYLGRPFEPMPQLMAVAEYVEKTLAICMKCGNPANHTQRLIESSDRVLVGAGGTYEARCRRCFEPFLSSAEHPPAPPSNSNPASPLNPPRTPEDRESD
jgi:thymidine kinase